MFGLQGEYYAFLGNLKQIPQQEPSLGLRVYLMPETPNSGALGLGYQVLGVRDSEFVSVCVCVL